MGYTGGSALNKNLNMEKEKCFKEFTQKITPLENTCPNCGYKLYAYWHTPASDYPELGAWYVECTNKDCKYEYGDSFPNLKWMAENFNVC